MAGIGFELRRLLARESSVGKLQAYAVAGVVGSGPWVLSIIAMLLIGIGQFQLDTRTALQAAFQVAVTSLMAASLLLTGPLQLAFTRFAADRIYQQQREQVLPNLLGLMVLTLLLAFMVGLLLLGLFFSPELFTPACRLALLCGFVCLCGIWLVAGLASAVHDYRLVFGAFVMGYGLTVGAALGLRSLGLAGLLTGFVIGQAALLFSLLALLAHAFPAPRLLAFDFLSAHRLYPSLMLTGACYSLALWVDKFVFWADPLAGASVIGPLRVSPIYDIPVFLSYLSLLPGMAVFLVHLETGVSWHCHRFFQTIAEGGTLAQVRAARAQLVLAVRGGLLAVFKVQGVTLVLVIASAADLLQALGLSDSYLPLFKVQLAAAAVELLLLSALSVLFYLDQRLAALRISVVFALSNALLSWGSLQLSPAFFGYGLLLSVLLCGGLAWHALWRALHQLEYQTFMLRAVAL